MHFQLAKWYFDVVTPGGEVGIAYRADVRYGGLHRSFSGVQMAAGGWHFSSLPVAVPTFQGNNLRWASEPLGLYVELERRDSPFEHRLLESSAGNIEWRCLAPCADIRMQAGPDILEGEGYVEELVMTILPWQIPADEIRWGHFHGNCSTMVWIDWRGEHPMQRVVLNGITVEAQYIDDNRVVYNDECVLYLNDCGVLGDADLGTMLGPLKWMRRIVEPVARVHQTRWISRAELTLPGAGACDGMAVHEVVRRA